MRAVPLTTGRDFGAIIEGLDLRRPMDAAQRRFVQDAIDRYAFLGFRNQRIEDAQQVAFSGLFGEVLEVPFGAAKGRMEHARVAEVSNLDLDGETFRPDSERKKVVDANLLWHSDVTYMPRAAQYTTLSAKILPPDPPPTEYADTRAAWDALPASRQRELDGLHVFHSREWSLQKTGATAPKSELEIMRSRHPLVRTNPRTGRKALYLASHAYRVDGWSLEASEALIAELIDHATQPQRVHAYRWEPYDFVMWDDFATLHRATPYGTEHKRELHWNAVLEPAAG